MKAWAVTGVVLLVAAIMLTGCLGVKTPPVSRPAAPTVFVDYQRSGGIAGADERLVIFNNGVTLISSRTTSREIVLNQSDLEQISAVFDAAQFSMLEGNFTSRQTGADFMQYSITYKGKTVNTEDTAIPSSLEPVITEMEIILRTGLTGGQTRLQLPSIAS